MGLLENLVFKKERENIIENLKQEDIPLFVWGSGNIAEMIRKYLLQNDIQVKGFFEWPSVRHEMFYNNKVYSLTELEESNSKYNVIIGHSHYSKAKGLLKSASNIKKIYFLFSFDYCGNKCNTFFDCNVIKDMAHQYEMIYWCLEDEKSRENLIAFLNTKMTGNVQYIFEIFHKEMSIFNNDIYSLNEKECYWNIGGGRGETIFEFLENRKKRFNQIVTLEPDYESFSFLCSYIKRLDYKQKIIAYQKAAWNKRESISFYHDNDIAESGSVQAGKLKKDCIVEGLPLDEIFLENSNILPPTLITANYFSGIVEMLEGCRLILKNDRPRLAIVVGHNDECGILRVVKAILNANPNYKLYLRFHEALSTTLVLYAII